MIYEKRKCVYNKHKPKKKKKKKEKRKCIVHVFSTSLVLSFLLGPPIFLFYLFSYLFIYLLCFIFLAVFSQTHFWMFTKPAPVRNYICTLLQILLRERVNRLSSGEAGSYSKEHTKKKKVPTIIKLQV